MQFNTNIEFNDQTKKTLLAVVAVIVFLAGIIWGTLSLIQLLYPITEDIPQGKTTINLNDPSIETTIKDVEKQSYFSFEATVNPSEIGRENPFEPY